MVNGWDGADPGQQNDGAAVDYELATRFVANTDISITAVRVWAGASVSVVGRMGRIWSTGGSVLASVAMDASLPTTGWTTYTLAAPLLVSSGTTFDVSYSTLQFYGAVAGGYPNPSSDLSVTATQGRFHDTPGSHPNNVTATFYGIDIVFDLAGNLPPEITSFTVTADGLVATGLVALTDEAPATVTARWVWGDGDESTTGAGVLTAEHTYDAPGLYAAFVVVTDDAALTDTAAVPVIVRDDTSGINIDAVFGELAERLRTIPGLQADKYGPENKRVIAPHALVTLPTTDITYNATYGVPGVALTELTAHVVVLLGKVHSRSAYKALAGYASVAGDTSIKSVIESGVYATCDDPMVTAAGFDEWTVAGDTYLAAIFDVHLGR